MFVALTHSLAPPPSPPPAGGSSTPLSAHMTILLPAVLSYARLPGYSIVQAAHGSKWLNAYMSA